MRRWALAMLMAAAIASDAQAQPDRVADLPVVAKPYLRLPYVWVQQLHSADAGEAACELLVDRFRTMLAIRWAPRTDDAVMIIAKPDWRFPAGEVLTPVQVFVGARPLGRTDAAPFHPHVMMRAEGNHIAFRWQGGLFDTLAAATSVRVRYLEGISSDDEFPMPAMRLIAMAVKACRADIEAQGVP